jgi:hypothetical protein
VQGAQLHHDEEQEDDHGPSRVLEVLQALPQTPAAQGNEVTSEFIVHSSQFTGGLTRREATVNYELGTVNRIQGRKLNG